MNTAYIYVNIVAVLCFALLFVAFFAAERTREMNAWVLILFDLTLWSVCSLFMSLDIYPGYIPWFYISILALYSIAFLVYNYVYQVANENNKLQRNIWLIGTMILLATSPFDVFIAPPDKIINEYGNAIFTYKTDWKVAIPTVFFLCIVASIIKLFRKILHQKGTNAPGVKELIIGCLLLIVANLIQIIPGNTFPWDMLFGVMFAVMISASLHKRRMFSTTRVISSSVLVTVSGILCVTAAAMIFPWLRDFCEKNLVRIAPPDTLAFILLAILLTAAIHAFKMLLNVIFRDQEHQNEEIIKYSDTVSCTLSVDDILSETVKVIRSELKTNQVIVCLREDDKFVPTRSTMPLKQSKFFISADNPCIKYLEYNDNHIVLKEFESNPIYKSMLKNERDAFRENGIISIFALKDLDRVIGLVLLSAKDKGATYSFSEFALMNTVCSVASMALKNAELYEHVAERENLFSGMTAFIPNVILIKKKNEPDFCFVSSNTEKVLGLSRESFKSHSIKSTLTKCVGEQMVDSIIKSFYDTPVVGKKFDIPFTRPDNNTERTIRCVFSPIVFEGVVSHYVCVLSDISDDIEARELLRSSAIIAQNSNKAKDDFLSHISHEIRTPMNSIAGLTYLARERIGKDKDDEISEYLDQIDQSSQYLLSLLNNIMDMSKIENQQFEIQKQPFDIARVFDEVYSVYSAQMQAKSISLEYKPENIKYKNLIGDEIALRKILNNLLSNAYKYTQEHGKVELYATQRSITPQTIVMHFEISDNGSGISKEFAEKIFEPYTQETTRNFATENGSGLGMAICKNIVDLQGGQISVSSDIGVGTKFVVDIPYNTCLGENQKENDDDLDYYALDGKHIMVVDDVLINTVITQKLLEKYGVLVDCAENGKQAVELFESKGDYYYDCILMDIQMPVMDGFEAAEKIRSKKIRYANIIPIVATTADAFISESANADRSNFDEYIIKPIAPNELYGKLIRLFNERG